MVFFCDIKIYELLNKIQIGETGRRNIFVPYQDPGRCPESKVATTSSWHEIVHQLVSNTLS